MDQAFAAFKEKEAARFKLKVGVFLLLIKNNQVLLLRRFQTGIDDGKYVVPMGGHDGHEPLSHAAVREAKEECNIEIPPENLAICHVMHRLHSMPHSYSFEQIDVFFKVNRYSGPIQNNETDRCDELAFFPIDNLPQNTAPFIRSAIDCVQKNIFYSEFGFEKL